MRLVLVAALLVVGAGCDWILPAEAPRFTEQAELTEPWRDLGLPVAEGKVTVSDADTLSVHHATGAPDALAGAYGEALREAGWSLDADTSAGAIVNQTWSREGTSLALSILEHDRVQVVSLSLLPF